MRITVLLAFVLATALPALPNTITATVSNVTSSAHATAGACTATGVYTAAADCSTGSNTVNAGVNLLAGSGGVASGIGAYANSLPVNSMQPVVSSGQASFQELFTLAGDMGGDYLFIPYTLQVDNGSDVFDANFTFGSSSYELTANGSSVFKSYVTYGKTNTFQISLNAATPTDPHHPSSGHAGATITFGNPYLSADPNATSGQLLNGTLFPGAVPEPGTAGLVLLGVAGVALGCRRRCRAAGHFGTPEKN